MTVCRQIKAYEGLTSPPQDNKLPLPKQVDRDGWTSAADQAAKQKAAGGKRRPVPDEPSNRDLGMNTEEEIRNAQALDAWAKVSPHLSDEQLETHHLGRIEDPAPTLLEEHILGCNDCADRAETSSQYVDGMRAATVAGNYDCKV